MFTVSARDVDGNVSPLSDPLLVTTAPAYSDDRTPPTQPANITAEDTVGSTSCDGICRATSVPRRRSSATTSTSTVSCVRSWLAPRRRRSFLPGRDQHHHRDRGRHRGQQRVGAGFDYRDLPRPIVGRTASAQVVVADGDDLEALGSARRAQSQPVSPTWVLRSVLPRGERRRTRARRRNRARPRRRW